ncbi:MAG: TlpA disulfide reductase family protein [Rhodanobacteraceae bacterium]
MIDRRATVVILVLATAAAVGGLWLQRASQPAQIPAKAPTSNVAALKVGDTLGEFTLPDLDGKPQSLSQWRGKLLLLNFWASWCRPCRKEMPQLAAAQKRYADRGVQIVGIALDQPEAVRDYLKHTPVDYPILIGIDADPVPTERFGDSASLLPYSVLIGRDGRILDTKLGDLSAVQLDRWLRGNG